MRTPLPKRFYKDVAVAAGEGGFAVQLDGKPVKTPGKALLVLPTEQAAAAGRRRIRRAGRDARPG